MHQVQQGADIIVKIVYICTLTIIVCPGDHPGRRHLQERPLAQRVLHLHSLSEVSGRPEVHL